MIAVVTDPLAIAHVQRALDVHVHRWGRDKVPAEVTQLLDAIDPRSLPLDAMNVEPFEPEPQPVLVSFTEAARRLDCSNTTIGRMVKRGELDKRGRKITVASIAGQ